MAKVQLKRESECMSRGFIVWRHTHTHTHEVKFVKSIGLYRRLVKYRGFLQSLLRVTSPVHCALKTGAALRAAAQARSAWGVPSSGGRARGRGAWDGVSHVTIDFLIQHKSRLLNTRYLIHTNFKSYRWTCMTSEYISMVTWYVDFLT